MRKGQRLFGARWGAVATLTFLCAGTGCGTRADILRPRMFAEVWERGLVAVVEDPNAGRQTAPTDLAGTAAGHNERGQTLFRQGHYYEAVQEFESAIRSAPRWAEPRERLGVLYEAIGRSDRAILHYRAAVAVEPGRRSAMRRLARACVNAGGCNEDVRRLLERVAHAEDDPRWRTWARTQLAWRNRS